MQNPSYACVEYADKSVQVLERVIFEKQYPQFTGVERLIIVNLFAFIQTNDFSGKDDYIGERNDAAIARAEIDKSSRFYRLDIKKAGLVMISDAMTPSTNELDLSAIYKTLPYLIDVSFKWEM